MSNWIHQLALFFEMGHYGLYVWLAYGISALVIGLLLSLPYWQHQKIVKQLKRKLQLQDTSCTHYANND